MKRLLVVGSMLAAVLDVLAISPAQAAPAYPAPQVTDVSTSTPGHVTGTVHSTAPYVLVTQSWYGGTVQQVPMSDGVGTFSLETWGYGSSLRFLTLACPTYYPDLTNCGVTETPITANNPVPQVTWSSDTTVGPGQAIDVTVSDPFGEDGTLVLTGANVSEPLPRAGTTSLTPSGNGNYTVRVERCSAGGHSACADFPTPIAKRYEVLQSVQGSLEGTGPYDDITPVTGVRPTTTFTVHTGQPATTPYTMTWTVNSWSTQQPVAGTGSTVTGTLDSNGSTGPITVDASSVPEGNQFYIAGTITEDVPGFGTINGGIGGGFFTVDRTPNSATSFAATSSTTIYPRVNQYGYDGTVLFNETGAPFSDVRAEITDLQGSHVELAGMSWDGRDEKGAFVGPGTYYATLADDVGNPTPGIDPIAITVSGKRIYHETFTRTVSALASLEDKYVGKCSTLRSPSLRGWRGSLGLYSNTRCKTQTSKASDVSSIHSIQLPVAARYGDIQVAAYGGGAKSRPQSLVVMSYLRTNGKWADNPVFRGRMGIHKGQMMRTPRTAKDSPFVFSDRYLVWGMFTGFKNRYDVKSFTVTVDYAAVR